MKKLLAMLLVVCGGFASSLGSVACTAFIIDEPEMPKSMIER